MLLAAALSLNNLVRYSEGQLLLWLNDRHVILLCYWLRNVRVSVLALLVLFCLIQIIKEDFIEEQNKAEAQYYSQLNFIIMLVVVVVM